MITDKIYIYSLNIYIYIRIDVFIPPFFPPREEVMSGLRVLSLVVMSCVGRHTVRRSRGG